MRFCVLYLDWPKFKQYFLSLCIQFKFSLEKSAENERLHDAADHLPTFRKIIFQDKIFPLQLPEWTDYSILDLHLRIISAENRHPSTVHSGLEGMDRLCSASGQNCQKPPTKLDWHLSLSDKISIRSKLTSSWLKFCKWNSINLPYAFLLCSDLIKLLYNCHLCPELFTPQTQHCFDEPFDFGFISPCRIFCHTDCRNEGNLRARRENHQPSASRKYSFHTWGCKAGLWNFSC